MNLGIYHPILNGQGTYKASDDKFWYETTVPLNTVADCFKPANIGTVNGRPDSKSDKYVYAENFIPVNEYAKLLTPYEVELIRDDKEENGVEEVVSIEYLYNLGIMQDLGSSRYRIYSGAYKEVFESYSGIIIKKDNGVFVPVKIVDSYDVYNTIISPLSGTLELGIVSIYGVISKPILTSGSKLSIDLIGDPAPYNSADATYKTTIDVSITDMPTGTLVWDTASGQMYKALVATNDLDANGLPVPAFTDTSAWSDVYKGYPQVLRDRLASGVGCVGVNPLLVGQDGTSYINSLTNVILSEKNIFSLNSTASLLGFNIVNGKLVFQANTNINNSTNNVSNTLGMNTTWAKFNIKIGCYTSKNQPYIQSTPKPVIDVEPKVIATNSHSIYKGALIGNQVSGKIQVGNGSNGYESKVLENAENNEYDVYLNVLVKTKVNNGDIVVIYNNNYVQNGQLAIRVGAGFDSTIGATSNIVDDNIYWKFIGKLQVPTHSTLALDNSNSPASKYFKALSQGNNGVVATVYGKELAYNATNSAFDGDNNTFDQLINGTETDLNANTVRTFVGHLPINGEVK